MLKQCIYVTIKNVYGIEKVYPACEKSHLFARIAGTVILTDNTISNIKKLGYELVLSPINYSILG